MPAASYRALQPHVMACRSCKAPMFFAKVASIGKAIPIEAAPASDGNIVLLDPRTCIVLGPEDAAAETGLKYRTHFMTCPNAKGWRRKRGFAEQSPRAS